MILPMKIHTFAKLFPVLTGPDFDALVADIKANGLREKITTLGGMVLDGQNRFLACQAAQVAPEYEPYEGNDPLAFVVSKNMSRRHLTNDQRAAIAAEIAKALSGKPVNTANSAVLAPKPTVSEAAAMLKVSPRKVQRAKAIKAESPAAFRAVKEGKLSLNAAHEQKHPRHPKAEPEQPANSGEITVEPESFPMAPVKLPFTITPDQFKSALGSLEQQVNATCLGNQVERIKFGIIANAMAGRLMNPPQIAGIYTR